MTEKIVRIPKDKELPEAGIVDSPKPSGEQPAMMTGNWRTTRSIINLQDCTQCYTCWISCPDACIAIDEDENPVIDLKYCKGCGVCAAVCPTECISREPELDFEGGVERLEKLF